MSKTKTALKIFFNHQGWLLTKIEIKIELYRFQKFLKNLKYIYYIKRFYLIFIIVLVTSPLFSIDPNANAIYNLQSVEKSIITYEYNNSINSFDLELSENKYTIADYRIKNGETLNTILARLPEVKKESLLVNNLNSNFKENEIIKIPLKNGLYVKLDNNFKKTQISNFLKKSIQEVEMLADDNKSIFVQTNDPYALNKSIEPTIYKINNNESVTFVSKSKTGYTNSKSNLSEQLNAFINKFQGTRAHDGNGWGPGQCVSLVKQWQLYLGAGIGVWPGGYPRSAWNAYINGSKGLAPQNESFEIEIVHSYLNLMGGDIVIINTPTSHTAIATGNITNNGFEVFDQNSPVGSASRINNYSPTQFIGALRYIKK
ncbi:MAG: hypothetical protein ACRCXZ_06800 [Patescibacteria group bacterium]